MQKPPIDNDTLPSTSALTGPAADENGVLGFATALYSAHQKYFRFGEKVSTYSGGGTDNSVGQIACRAGLIPT
jgi:hypothetical protein